MSPTCEPSAQPTYLHPATLARMKNQVREEKAGREQRQSEKEDWGSETLRMEELASFVRFAMPSKLGGGRLHIYTVLAQSLRCLFVPAAQ